MDDQGKMLLDAVAALHEERTGRPEGSLTIKEIEEKLEIGYNAALDYVNQLIQDGKALKIRRGNNQHYYVFKE